MTEFCMPSLGADMEAGTLREWRVKPGNSVQRGDIIADVETQKGIVEVEVFNDGKVHQLLIKENQKVPVGTPMALILDPGEEPSKKKEAIKTPADSTRPPARRIKASPLAKRIAQEYRLSLSDIEGTGPEGAITREDVEKIISEKTILQEPAPEVSAEKAETIRAAIAAAMSKSNREIPHYFIETKIDMSKSLAWLREENKKRSVKDRLLPAALLIKAVANALKKVPELNAVWENGLRLKEEINTGFVVSVRTGGIVIPAIHQAAKKSPDQIMQSLNDIIPRAKAMKLRSSELSDSTITITSLGDNNAETVYGVIYPPQVALVGFGSITDQPWAENGMLGIRPVLTATLAGDHRATDGQTGSRFLMAVKNALQKPEEL